MAAIRIARAFNRPDVDAFLDEISLGQYYEQLAYETLLEESKSHVDIRQFGRQPYR